MRKRTKGRLWAIQIAYGALLSGKPTERALREFFTQRRVGPENRDFTTRLLLRMTEHTDEIDELFIGCLQNWSIHRLAVLDKLMLRLAITEFLYIGDVPPKVTINEYVQLAHFFGTEDSPRFLNGVLDAVYRSLIKSGALLEDEEPQ
ncbi:transcription antitermination factor NusB [bacterium]|nr:transcription antitermination factor NusB [bacterium]